MTQTTIATATPTFPIEMVNLIDTKQFHLAEHHCFSLLAYNRIRIEQAGTPETAGSVVVLSRTEGKRLTSFLAELAARGELRAMGRMYPSVEIVTNPDGTKGEKPVHFAHMVQWDFSSAHEWDFWSDRSLWITNFQTDVTIRLNQAEVLQLLAWLQQEHVNDVPKNLY